MSHSAMVSVEAATEQRSVVVPTHAVSPVGMFGLPSAQTAQIAEPRPLRIPYPLAENLLTRHLRPVLPEDQTKAILQNRGVPKLDELNTVSNEEKIAALGRLPFAYWASTAAARFTQRVVAQVRTSLHLRNPEDPRYARFFYGQADVMRGGRLLAMPSFLHSLQGASFILAGPSGAGKTALIQRLRKLIGQEHTIVRGTGAAPAEMIFLPMLVLQWPNCGTLEGLLSNFRDALIGELGSSNTSESAFSNFRGRKGQNAAIATCVFLNLGLLVLDGLCIRSLQGEFREILSFISTLKAHSGIPTIISCTYPALQGIARGGSKLANLGSAHQEYLDLEPPGNEWNKRCQSFWKLGFHEPDLEMPAFLPALMWNVTLGNMRLLVEGFSAIHHDAIYQPDLLTRGKEPDFAEILDLRLRMFKESLSVMKLFQIKRSKSPTDNVSSTDLWTHGDYLPYGAFSDTPSGDFERFLKQPRIQAQLK